MSKDVSPGFMSRLSWHAVEEMHDEREIERHVVRTEARLMRTSIDIVRDLCYMDMSASRRH